MNGVDGNGGRGHGVCEGRGYGEMRTVEERDERKGREECVRKRERGKSL